MIDWGSLIAKGAAAATSMIPASIAGKGDLIAAGTAAATSMIPALTAAFGLQNLNKEPLAMDSRQQVLFLV